MILGLELKYNIIDDPDQAKYEYGTIDKIGGIKGVQW